MGAGAGTGYGSSMQVSQSIGRPIGINVFGSYVLRVEPDVALVRVVVACLEQEPSAAFATNRAAVAKVRAFLTEAGVPTADVQSSHVRLSDEHVWKDRERVHLGYRASVGLAVRLTALSRFEEIVAGVIEAGANEIQSTEFATTKLAEHRAEARRGAFAAARRKAELYAGAADVRLGGVLHVEDIDPGMLRGRESHGADLELSADESGQAAAPGSIEVKASVMVSFAIERGKRTSGFG